jgi:hypothetical protein
MRLKVVTQLAPRQDHGEEQLLDLWIPGLCLGQDFTDEVYWLLDREHMSLLLSLDDDSRADHRLVVVTYSKGAPFLRVAQGWKHWRAVL